MRKCTKTVSGKHLWEERVYTWKTETIGIRSVIGPDKTYKQCLACGIVDDRPAPKRRRKG